MLEPCRRALAALEVEGDLLQLSDRGNCTFRTKPVRQYFRTAQALVNGIERGDVTAVGCLAQLTRAAGLASHTRAIVLSVLAEKELHADEYLVLECARELVEHDDEAAYRALLPFAVGSWAGGGVHFRRAVFARRVEVLLEFLREVRPFTNASVRWPTLREAELTGAELPEQGEWVRHASMIEDVYDAGTKEQREELVRVADELFQGASTQRARSALALTLARLGFESACFESCESVFEHQRLTGFMAAQKYFGARLVERYGHLFESDGELEQQLRASFSNARGKRLGPPVRSFDQAQWLFVYQRCRWDVDNHYTRDVPQELRLAWYDPKQRRVTRDHSFAQTEWEPQGVTITHPKESRGRWLAIQAINNVAAVERYYVTYDQNESILVARSKDELKEIMRTSAPMRAQKAAVK
ncbi:MAG: hypothetical protein ACOY0T_21170 [Myxococcota bacterium]